MISTFLSDLVFINPPTAAPKGTTYLDIRVACRIKDCLNETRSVVAIVGALLAALVNVASAQPSQPDTLDWREYFPLAVGNQWQYYVDDFEFSYYERWTVRSDTVIEAKAYYNLDIHRFQSTTPHDLIATETATLAYDSAGAFIVERTESGEDWWRLLPCRMDAPFGAAADCDGHGQSYFVDGSRNALLQVGADTARVDALKRFDSLGGIWDLGSGVGLTYRIVEGGIEWTLVYSRVGAVELGGPAVPTFTENDYERTGLHNRLVVFPNPSTSTITITSTGAGALGRAYRVLDISGRVLVQAALDNSASLQLDVSRYAAGVYFAVVDAATGSSTAVQFIVFR